MPKLHDILTRLLLALIILTAASCDDAEQKVFRVAYVSGPTELLHDAARNMAKRIEAESAGRIEVRLYPSGQLGNDRELIESLRLGGIDMVITGLAMVGWYAPEYSMVEAPFLWRDYGHIEQVWQGPIGREIRDTMHKRTDLELRDPWFRGPRYLTTTSKIISHPDDLVGLKLRVPELEVYIKSWQTFGANVTPLPFTDMFMALKLGVVEGQENPLATIYGNNLHEAQHYVMETKHLIGFYVPATGPYFQRRYSKAERRLINDALAAATRYHNDEVANSESEYREKLIAAGVEFIAIDNEPFRELARRQIPTQFADTWKPGLYEAISRTE